MSDVSGERCTQRIWSSLISNKVHWSVGHEVSGVSLPLQQCHTCCFAGEQSSGSGGTGKVLGIDLLEVRGQDQRFSCLSHGKIEMETVPAKHTNMHMNTHTYRTASLLCPARCYAPPPYFRVKLLYRYLHYTPPRRLVCGTARVRVLQVYQACRK